LPSTIGTVLPDDTAGNALRSSNVKQRATARAYIRSRSDGKPLAIRTVTDYVRSEAELEILEAAFIVPVLC
jgi:hypothetical protein